MTVEKEQDLDVAELQDSPIKILGVFIAIALIIFGIQKVIGVEDTTMNSIIPISIAGVFASIMSNDLFTRLIFILMSVVILPVVGMIA